MKELFEPECIWPLGAELGEGPVWSDDDQALWFVDIKQNRIHRFDPATAGQTRWDAPTSPSFLAPIAGGHFILGCKDGLRRFDPAAGAFGAATPVEADLAGNRLNDGAVDAAGRLWFGSMDDGESAPTGRLYRADARGICSVDEDYVITNGPAASPDGRRLYHTDTADRQIHVFDLADDGTLSNKRLFVEIEAGAGHPDGSTVDAAGNLWTTLWGGWSARCYSPDGVLLRTVRFPCANVTKIAFGGADLRTAFATTAWNGLVGLERADQPLAGGLFSFLVDTPGQPQHLAAYDIS